MAGFLDLHKLQRAVCSQRVFWLKLSQFAVFRDAWIEFMAESNVKGWEIKWAFTAERVNLANHSDTQIQLALLSCPIAAPQFAPPCAVQLCSVFSVALVQHLEIAISVSTSERYESILLGRVCILQSAAASSAVYAVLISSEVRYKEKKIHFVT